jgi:hypothetical protein
MEISQDKLMESVMNGNLANLSPQEKLLHYTSVCHSLGLNSLTKPFEYMTLNGKQLLYATRNCTDQLRKLHKINIEIVSRETVEEIFIVTVRANSLIDNRQDESIGAVTIGNFKGDAKANAIMKAETKAKRRATLSICGLSFLDESEFDTMGEKIKTVKEKFDVQEIDNQIETISNEINSITHKYAVGEIASNEVVKEYFVDPENFQILYNLDLIETDSGHVFASKYRIGKIASKKDAKEYFVSPKNFKEMYNMELIKTDSGYVFAEIGSYKNANV